MELPTEYWPDIRRNCATILGNLPVIKKWVAWPFVSTSSVSAEWTDNQNRPEVLARFRDQVASLSGRALLDVTTHQLTLQDSPYPISICFDPDNQRLMSAFPSHGYPLYHGFKGVQDGHYERLYESIARGAQAGQ